MSTDGAMAPFYADPLHEQLDAIECSAERFHDPAALSPPGPGDDPDPLGQALGQLESSIEWTTVPPLRPFGEPEPPPIQPGPPAPTVYGSFSREPPAPQEPWERPWGMVEPPLAARPYFAHDGLSRESYRPHPGSNTGSLGRTSVPTRWCPDRGEAIEVTACKECDKWSDHGGQMEECLYDSEEKQQAKEGHEDESEE